MYLSENIRHDIKIMDIKSVYIMRIYITVIILHVLDYSSGHSIDASFHDAYFKFRRKREAQCAAKFYKISPGHTACLSRSPSVRNTGVSEADKYVIVDEHNRVRSAVNNPTARDMRELSWDDEIANVAQRWAENCRIGHDQGYKRRIYGRYSVGQNLSWGNYKMTWLQAMALWSNEVKDFIFGARNNARLVGHYTQMVWSKTVKIGCGYAQCGDTHYYVCNYGPAGNFDYNRPYEAGASCADCKRTCRNNLCDCGGAVCLNDGTMDLNTCTCTCYKGLKFYSLPYCGLNCSDVEDKEPFYCDTQFRLPDCQAYSNVPHMCPAMCQWCPAAGMKYDDTISGSTSHIGLSINILIFVSLILIKY